MTQWMAKHTLDGVHLFLNGVTHHLISWYFRHNRDIKKTDLNKTVHIKRISLEQNYIGLETVGEIANFK